MTILNLTIHPASKEQIIAGVIEPADKSEVKALLLFKGLPTALEVVNRAEMLSIIAKNSGHNSTMIGGAPFLMSPLVDALKNHGIIPIFAFSERISEEKVVDGKVIKTNIFKHIGFVKG